jgi:hypothetical protein
VQHEVRVRICSAKDFLFGEATVASGLAEKAKHHWHSLMHHNDAPMNPLINFAGRTWPQCVCKQHASSTQSPSRQFCKFLAGGVSEAVSSIATRKEPRFGIQRRHPYSSPHNLTAVKASLAASGTRRASRKKFVYSLEGQAELYLVRNGAIDELPPVTSVVLPRLGVFITFSSSDFSAFREFCSGH